MKNEESEILCFHLKIRDIYTSQLYRLYYFYFIYWKYDWAVKQARAIEIMEKGSFTSYENRDISTTIITSSID